MSRRARILRRVRCLAFAAAAEACRPTAPEAAPTAGLAGLPGCYALYTGNGQSVDGRFYHASPLVRLDTAGLRWGEGLRLMTRLDAQGRPMDGDSSRALIPPAWQHNARTDTVVFSFVDGFSGATLSLHAPPGARDTLRGKIYENWDMGPTTQDRGAAYAVRVPCRATTG
jgi:hypothetical protein